MEGAGGCTGRAGGTTGGATGCGCGAGGPPSAIFIYISFCIRLPNLIPSPNYLRMTDNLISYTKLIYVCPYKT